MHELSIAQSILDIVRQHAGEQRAAAVRAVSVRVGPLSGVVPDSLSFCFGALVEGTAFGQAALAVESVPIRCRCRQCDACTDVYELTLCCPACGGTQVELTGGDELLVHQIELADDAAEVS